MFRKCVTVLASLLLVGSTAFASEKGKETVTVNKLTDLADSKGQTIPAGQLKCTTTDGGKLLCSPLADGQIVLTKQNLVVLRGPIDGQSASRFVQDFGALENQDEVTTIYVYIRSPGGSIFAGDKIANAIRFSKKKVVAIVDFAASMAFHVTQHADERVVEPTATLMQHHASGGTGFGEFPNVDKQWDWIKRKVKEMHKFDATACTATTLEQFEKNTDRDWWLLAEEAVTAGCADKVASSISCSKDLVDSYKDEEFSFFGFRILLRWSGCPLEVYPRQVAVRNISGYAVRLNDNEVQQVDKFLLLISDPLKFYMQNGSFEIGPAAPITNQSRD